MRISSSKLARSFAIALSLGTFSGGGCGSGPERGPERGLERGGPSEPTPPVTADPVAPVVSVEPPTTSSSTVPRVPPADEPPPAVTIETRATDGEVQVSIGNESDAPVRFSSRLVLESRREDGAWSEVTDRGRFVARLDAETPLPDCAELVRGASLELAFRALRGEGGAEADAAPGTYRFVVVGCEGSGRAEGEPVTLPRP